MMADWIICRGRVAPSGAVMVGVAGVEGAMGVACAGGFGGVWATRHRAAAYRGRIRKNRIIIMISRAQTGLRWRGPGKPSLGKPGTGAKNHRGEWAPNPGTDKTGMNFRQNAPEIHVSPVCPRRARRWRSWNLWNAAGASPVRRPGSGRERIRPRAVRR